MAWRGFWRGLGVPMSWRLWRGEGEQSSWRCCREEQPLGRKIPADLEVFGEKEYFYKKKDAQ